MIVPELCKSGTKEWAMAMSAVIRAVGISVMSPPKTVSKASYRHIYRRMRKKLNQEAANEEAV